MARGVRVGVALWGLALGCGDDARAPQEAGETDPLPRMGAPAAIGDAPERPVQPVVPEPDERPDRPERPGGAGP
jgi:hypothetical protein